MALATLATAAPVRDRCMPVDEAFASMLPDAGLVRGRVAGCVGPAAMSLALALASRSGATGSWIAMVGVPMLGVEAADELGVPLDRLVAVDADGGPSAWAERVGVAADGFDLIITRPPPGAARTERKVRQRLQARGVVLLAVDPVAPSMSCDLEFSTSRVDWVGLGQGFGALRARRATVRVGGRRVPRPVEHELWLPGPGGGVSAVEPVDSVDHVGRSERAEPVASVGTAIDRHVGPAIAHRVDRVGEGDIDDDRNDSRRPVGAVADLVELERAG